MQNRVILKINLEGLPECFSSLKTFFGAYPEWESKREAINRSISRKKQPFRTEKFYLVRASIKKGAN